jgi:hypothetical protein
VTQVKKRERSTDGDFCLGSWRKPWRLALWAGRANMRFCEFIIIGARAGAFKKQLFCPYVVIQEALIFPSKVRQPHHDL